MNKYIGWLGLLGIALLISVISCNADEQKTPINLIAPRLEFDVDDFDSTRGWIEWRIDSNKWLKAVPRHVKDTTWAIVLIPPSEKGYTVYVRHCWVNGKCSAAGSARITREMP